MMFGGVRNQMEGSHMSDGDQSPVGRRRSLYERVAQNRNVASSQGIRRIIPAAEAAVSPSGSSGGPSPGSGPIINGTSSGSNPQSKVKDNPQSKVKDNPAEEVKDSFDTYNGGLLVSPNLQYKSGNHSAIKDTTSRIERIMNAVNVEALSERILGPIQESSIQESSIQVRSESPNGPSIMGNEFQLRQKVMIFENKPTLFGEDCRSYNKNSCNGVDSNSIKTLQQSTIINQLHQKLGKKLASQFETRLLTMEEKFDLKTKELMKEIHDIRDEYMEERIKALEYRFESQLQNFQNILELKYEKNFKLTMELRLENKIKEIENRIMNELIHNHQNTFLDLLLKSPKLDAYISDHIIENYIEKNIRCILNELNKKNQILENKVEKKISVHDLETGLFEKFLNRFLFFSSASKIAENNGIHESTNIVSSTDDVHPFSGILTLETNNVRNVRTSSTMINNSVVVDQNNSISRSTMIEKNRLLHGLNLVDSETANPLLRDFIRAEMSRYYDLKLPNKVKKLETDFSLFEMHMFHKHDDEKIENAISFEKRFESLKAEFIPIIKSLVLGQSEEIKNELLTLIRGENDSNTTNYYLNSNTDTTTNTTNYHGTNDNNILKMNSTFSTMNSTTQVSRMNPILERSIKKLVLQTFSSELLDQKFQNIMEEFRIESENREQKYFSEFRQIRFQLEKEILSSIEKQMIFEFNNTKNQLHSEQLRSQEILILKCETILQDESDVFDKRLKKLEVSMHDQFLHFKNVSLEKKCTELRSNLKTEIGCMLEEFHRLVVHKKIKKVIDTSKEYEQKWQRWQLKQSEVLDEQVGKIHNNLKSIIETNINSKWSRLMQDLSNHLSTTKLSLLGSPNQASVNSYATEGGHRAVNVVNTNAALNALNVQGTNPVVNTPVTPGNGFRSNNSGDYGNYRNSSYVNYSAVQNPELYINSYNPPEQHNSENPDRYLYDKLRKPLNSGNPDRYLDDKLRQQDNSENPDRYSYDKLRQQDNSENPDRYSYDKLQQEQLGLDREEGETQSFQEGETQSFQEGETQPSPEGENQLFQEGETQPCSQDAENPSRMSERLLPSTEKETLAVPSEETLDQEESDATSDEDNDDTDIAVSRINGKETLKAGIENKLASRHASKSSSKPDFSFDNTKVLLTKTDDMIREMRSKDSTQGANNVHGKRDIHGMINVHGDAELGSSRDIRDLEFSKNIRESGASQRMRASAAQSAPTEDYVADVEFGNQVVSTLHQSGNQTTSSSSTMNPASSSAV